MNSLAKPARIRSKALTDSARGRDCTLRWLCNSHSPKDVVFCHVRIHSGIGTKPPDLFGFYGCGRCHADQERGDVPSFEIMRAIMETQSHMARDGLIIIKGWKP